MLHKAWNSKREMPYCFPRSSIKFQGHMGQNITDFNPNWAFPNYRPVAAFKSLRFALLSLKWVWNLLIWGCSQIPQGPMSLINMILLMTWQWQMSNKDKTLNPQKAHPTSPSRVNYGVYFMNILEKTTVLQGDSLYHCFCLQVVYQAHTKSWPVSVARWHHQVAGRYCWNRTCHPGGHYWN